MDIDTFLQMKPLWAYEPCLYIVKQMFPGNNAFRCGQQQGIPTTDRHGVKTRREQLGGMRRGLGARGGSPITWPVRPHEPP